MRWRLAILVTAACLGGTASSRADDAPLTASMQCDRAVEPGRVRCTVEARSTATLQWADVVLIEMPPFAEALKGRLAPADSIARDATSERWAFGLIAKKTGDGEVKAKVRAVLCKGDRCSPVEIAVSTSVHVG